MRSSADAVPGGGGTSLFIAHAAALYRRFWRRSWSAVSVSTFCGHVLCSTCDEDCTNVNARLAKCGVFSDQRGDRKRENTFSHLHDVRREKKGRRPTVVAEHEGSLQADAETWGENTRMRKLLISSVIHYNAAIMSDLMYSANSWRYCPGYAKTMRSRGHHWHFTIHEL